MRALSSMKIIANKDEVLATIIANRDKHKQIVIEAREGYLGKAKAELETRLVQLREGKIVSLSFNLTTPQDHTKVYDTAIGMLQLHQPPTIELNSDQIKSLLQDEWDWKATFLSVNSGYSEKASLMWSAGQD